MKMSPSVILDFFGSVGVSDACPMCSKTEWLIPENTELEGASGLLTRVDSADSRKYAVSALFVYLICKNCGFARQHARPQIAEGSSVRWGAATGGRPGSDGAGRRHRHLDGISSWPGGQ